MIAVRWILSKRESVRTFKERPQTEGEGGTYQERDVLFWEVNFKLDPKMEVETAEIQVQEVSITEER